MKTANLLKKYSIKLKKSLSQNFLSDERVARRIVEAAGIGQGNVIVEIGAGAGTLTEEIAKVASKVYAIEIDERLKDLLEERLKGYRNVQLIFEDFLKLDLSFLEDGFSYVANIPYKITGRIIEKILKEGRFEKAILMVQKEVAQRILSEPGKRSYGYLTVLVKSFCNVEKLFDVSKSHFLPNPEVDSTVIKITFKGYDMDFESYKKFVSAIFSSKRKTIKNNLKSIAACPEALLEKANIDPKKRAEQLSIGDIKRLYLALSEERDMNV